MDIVAAQPNSAKTPTPELWQGSRLLAHAIVACGCEFATAYPGSPMVEVSDTLARLAEQGACRFHYAVNEKIAFEMAAALAFAGRPVACVMKHAGLLVALDAVSCVAYTGVGAGFVLAVGDDPACESSATETDSRVSARLMGLPCVQPHAIADIPATLAAAYQLSRSIGLPVIYRLTPELAHGATTLTFEREALPRVHAEPRTASQLGRRFVLAPGNARALHEQSLARLEQAREFGARAPLRLERIPDPLPDIGFVVDSTCLRSFELAAARLGVRPAIFSPALVWPLDLDGALAFCRRFARVVVVEALEPVLEEQLAGALLEQRIAVVLAGKSLFPRHGKLDETTMLERLATLLERPLPARIHVDLDILAPRPPTFCPGCPHTAFFYAFRLALARLPEPPFVGSDVGCYAMGAKPGIEVGHAILCMGASLGLATGAALQGSPAVAIIGDGTFLHAGLPALVNAVEAGVDLVVCILDNGATAMTGGQPPLRDREAGRIEALALASGAAEVRVIDPFAAEQLADTLVGMFGRPGVSVVISRSPCVLTRPKPRVHAVVDPERCTGVGDCITRIHCPALALAPEGKARIDPTLCTNCGLCAKICPEHAIVPG